MESSGSSEPWEEFLPFTAKTENLMEGLEGGRWSTIWSLLQTRVPTQLMVCG